MVACETTGLHTSIAKCANLEGSTISQELIDSKPAHSFRQLIKSSKALASKVSFTGTDKPILPITWKMGEAMTALMALEGTMANLLITKISGGNAQTL